MDHGRVNCELFEWGFALGLPEDESTFHVTRIGLTEPCFLPTAAPSLASVAGTPATMDD